MSNYIPMIVALLGWAALWGYLFSLDLKVKRLKRNE
jgi:hypothetical protein